jgi:hypothetical protein
VIAQSVYRWDTGWTIGVLGFDSWRGLGIFLFGTASITALGPTQLPIQWVPGALSLAIKRTGCEADYSCPSSAEIKECVELYLHCPNTPSWRGAHFKHRDNFTFTFIHIKQIPMLINKKFPHIFDREFTQSNGRRVLERKGRQTSP